MIRIRSWWRITIPVRTLVAPTYAISSWRRNCSRAHYFRYIIHTFSSISWGRLGRTSKRVIILSGALRGSSGIILIKSIGYFIKKSNKKPLFIMNKGFYKGGGAGRNRTDDRGFAVLGLTTWRPRHYLCNKLQ